MSQLDSETTAPPDDSAYAPEESEEPAQPEGGGQKKGGKKRRRRQRALEKLRYTWLAERVFLAWIRTGIALIALGFLLSRLGAFLQWMRGPARQANITPQEALWAGIASIGLGVFVSGVATWRLYRTRKAILRGDVLFHGAQLTVLVGLLTAAVGIILLIFLTSALAS